MPSQQLLSSSVCKLTFLVKLFEFDAAVVVQDTKGKVTRESADDERGPRFFFVFIESGERVLLQISSRILNEAHI